MEAEIQTLKEIYAALNRNDIPAMLSHFDPEAEWSEFLGSPNGGTYTGRDALEAHFQKSRDSWLEGTCEPEQFVPVGDKIVAFNYVRVTLKANNQYVEGPTTDVYTFKEGKVVHVRVFDDRQEALAWAGLQTAV